MVPSLSVHVAAASVKATVRCLHWVACLAKKHCYIGTTWGMSVLVAVWSRREWIWPLTRFASRKWRSGLNRISHPDWVKFSVELNCAPKQNTRFSSSLQDERGCDEGDWHTHTGGLVGTVQQVHCSRKRLLRRGQEFHVCTINKSAHTKKKNWKHI